MITTHYYNYIFKRFRILPTRGTISRRTWYPRVDSKKISVILLKDSDKFGKTGDIVETSRGYANYHLIPNGIACYANWYNIDLYSKASAADTHRSTKDKTIETDEDGSILNSRPELILFTGRFGGYNLSLSVNTFASDRNTLTTPISLYHILDEFSKTYNIDILPSQINEVRSVETGQPINLFDDLGHFKFCNIGKYVFVVDFPLKDNHENKFEFTLELKPLNLRRENSDLDSSDFHLPQHSSQTMS